MRAMLFEAAGNPLREVEFETPVPDAQQLRLRVLACGVCRTDLHIVDGELSDPKLPLIPGHQIVGVVDALGDRVDGFEPGDRVGVPWLGGSCGACGYCSTDRENLCDEAVYTGYQVQGGFAEFCVADARFCFPIPRDIPDLNAAPLLCAGLIGYRALKFAGDAKRIGLYGFGASAHILIQIALHQGREALVFTRPGDVSGQQFARSLGASWAGDSSATPPRELDAALIFAPVGKLVPAALRAVAKGGVVVCAGIHMSDIPSFPYELLWGERVLRSVANLTRRDGDELFAMAQRAGVRTQVTAYTLADTNRALDDIRAGRIDGAAVIRVCA
ncbi:MAG: zinc-dependent alcohol dehydrogenase family protein [Myxococcota bacterium]|jgi:propanol-preferring alcohol dehydrogenase